MGWYATLNARFLLGCVWVYNNMLVDLFMGLEFVLPYPCPTLHYEKNLIAHPLPLGPYEAPPHPVKLYFLLICP